MAILSRIQMKTKLDLLQPSSKDAESVSGEILRSILRDLIDSGGNTAATDTVEGIIELSTDAELVTGTAIDRAITPANITALTSLETRAGIVELATDAETSIGTDTARAMTVANLRSLLAAASDINTGTDDTKWLSANALAGSILGRVTYAVTAFSTDLNNTTGDAKAHFVCPADVDGMNLVAVSAVNGTAGVTGQLDVMIHNLTDTSDMLTTVISIDTTEISSVTAATPAVIDTTEDDVVTNDIIRIDVDVIHSGTAAKGLVVNLTFQLP